MAIQSSFVRPTDAFENECKEQGYTNIAGIDEAGRGPWAGPVVAAAVILPSEGIPEGLNDSKKLTLMRRESLFDQLQACAVIGVGKADPEEIDRVNILQATAKCCRI